MEITNGDGSQVNVAENIGYIEMRMLRNLFA